MNNQLKIAMTLATAVTLSLTLQAAAVEIPELPADVQEALTTEQIEVLTDWRQQQSEQRELNRAALESGEVTREELRTQHQLERETFFGENPAIGEALEQIRVERPQGGRGGFERHARMERPERMDRPEGVERPEGVDRPEGMPPHRRSGRF